MSTDDAIRVTETLSIPRAELEARASRAGGPGGQHVNTSSTRIELLWDFAHSSVMTDEQRALIVEKLAGRLDADGRLRIAASDERSQAQNRELAEERMADLVRSALHVRKKRKATRPTRASKEKRLDEKKRHGAVKRNRKSSFDE